ncbi:LAQU0S01e12728g1_1 [Lachancea quebecensis]|uniref:LAQU0S01e12728g1_1 n=1 Tax=Lachancea quebecensis TaxID=1654605 RepID=A0A0P1KPV9_9SACH|nr:LAQU0S01e12728g1_1 [Lachancea quebecensis]
MGQKGSKIEVTKTDKAILQIKLSKDELHRYTRRTEILIRRERESLKALLREDPKNGKKNPRARVLLKKIHYQNHLLEQAADQLINLENLVSTVEFKLVEQQFMMGLKQGNEVLTKLNKEFTGAEDLMDSVADQIAYQDEVDQILSSSVVGGFEEELDRELQQLDQEVNGPVHAPANAEPKLPSTEGLPTLPGPEPEPEEPQKETQGSERQREAVLT